MNILLAGSWSDAQAREWRDALVQALAMRTAADGSGGAGGPCSPQDWRWFNHRGDCPDAQLDVAVVANPAPGALRGLTGLRLIQSLWAGVDRLLDDPDLPPDVPVARMVDPAMNAAMAQTALWATLSLHRGFFAYARQQAALSWQVLPQTRADECPVLVLGMGEMGRTTAQLLRAAGYPVTVWRRRPDATDLPGVATVHGPLGLSGPPSPQASAPLARHHGSADDGPTADAAAVSAAQKALAGCRVLINLLPLTPATRGLIQGGLLQSLRDDAGIVNLARGAHVVEADLLAWLDRRPASQAVLDVFQTEPLPADHPFWRHPRINLLPHAAAQTDHRSAAAVAVDNLLRLASGQPLRHRVDRQAGY